MRSSGNIWHILAAPVLVLLCNCTGLRSVPKGEQLYTGYELKVQGSLKPQKTDAIIEIRGLITPEPNQKIWWMRPRLVWHTWFKEPKKEKGFKYWFKYKLGKPPVLISQVKEAKIASAISNRLYQRGYFNNDVSAAVRKKKRTASLQYTLSPRGLFLIDSIAYPTDSLRITREIHGMQPEAVIKSGDPYNLQKMKKERMRISQGLRDIGYQSFRDDYLVYRADSTLGSQKINATLGLKPTTPAKALRPYYLRDIYVHTDYGLNEYVPDTVRYKGLTFLQIRGLFEPKAIEDGIFMKPGELYSEKRRRYTLSYLLGYGVFRYADTRFFPVTDTSDQLDAHVYLVPRSKYAVTAEVSTVASTNNFAGPGLEFSFRDRNLFGGAEQLSVNLSGRYEIQFSGADTGNTLYQIGLESRLRFPKLMPISFPGARRFVPFTDIGLGVATFSRVDFYRLNSFNANYGYAWRINERLSQQFRPLDITFTNLAESSDEFQDFLDRNPGVARSFEQQFIVGASYGLIFTELFQEEKPWRFYFEGNVAMSGNLAYTISRISNEGGPTEDDPYQLFGVPFSQYVRVQPEFRVYRNIGKKENVLATRVIVGAAVPYGNSNTIPYIKQFFVGGTNSLRGFRARSVGPGTYQPPDSLSNVFIDQTGDIKLETNMEFRFGIVGLLKGGLFVDAGNVWLVNEDESRPGGVFRGNRFWKELAVDTGFGFRFDLSVVVVRLDLGFPIRKPWRPEGERWVFDEIDLSDREWRRENMILNFSVGFPF